MAKYQVCPQCQGEGRIVHPALSCPSSEDWSDPDFRENYMTGAYDIECPCCKGKRVVTTDDIKSYKEDLQIAHEMAMEMGYLA